MTSYPFFRNTIMDTIINGHVVIKKNTIINIDYTNIEIRKISNKIGYNDKRYNRNKLENQLFNTIIRLLCGNFDLIPSNPSRKIINVNNYLIFYMPHMTVFIINPSVKSKNDV